MGKLHDAAALVHAGVRATKPGRAVNFVCAPIVVLSVFLVAMRGANGPTRDVMQTFLGVDVFPSLPSPPPISRLPSAASDSDSDTAASDSDSDTAASSSDSESEDEERSEAGSSHASYESQPSSDDEDETSDSSSDDEQEQPSRSGVSFMMANRLYVSQETAETDAFEAYRANVAAATRQAADVQVLDSSAGGDPALDINQYVAERTRQHIRNILAPGSVSAETRLLAVCAAFFKAEWKTMFNVHETQPRPFRALKGSESGPTSTQEEDAGAGRASPPAEGDPRDMEAEHEEGEPGPLGESVELVIEHVPTMYVEIKKPPFFVQENDKLTAVGLPYTDTQYVMFLIMPKDSQKLPLLTIPPGKRHEMGFEDMDFPYVEQVIEEMKTKAGRRERLEIDVYLPKFHLRAEQNQVDLVNVFRDKLGIPAPFNPETADFSLIDGGLEKLYIELFAHAAEIDVNESGTVATGAAVASIAHRCLEPLPEKTFKVSLDGPFYFQLRYLAAKPMEEWSDEDTDTEEAAEGAASSPKRSSEGAAAAVAVEPASEPDQENQDIVLFSGNVVDPAAAQS